MSSKRSGSYARRKGHRYELKIVNEVKELGYPNVCTSRAESRNMDAKKVDVFDPTGEFPCYIQTKCTKSTPNYFTIKEEAGELDKPLVLFWNKQDNAKVNMKSIGEVVLLDKDFFYELITRLKK